MATKKASEVITVTPARFGTMKVQIVGTAPFVQHKFSQKARQQMLSAQEAGSTAKGKKKREPRDLEADYKGAMHLDREGRCGIPCPALRAALISACRLVGFQMTRAKLSVFVEPESFDIDDGTPLFYIEGEPEMHQASVRLESGVASVAVRPMWREWSATPSIRWDMDQFTVEDVYNLLIRAGLQVGLGEGRADSKKSHGCGWGSFRAGDILSLIEG